jgi:hypothetical protein
VSSPKIETLKIDPEFERLIDALSDLEFAELEKNIVRDGATDAIVIWNGTIIDGHHRYKICQKNNLPFLTRSMEFDSKEVVIEWMLRRQLGRRNLDKDRCGYYRGKLYNGLKGKVGRPEKCGQVDHIDEGRVCEQVAKETGSSEKTVRRDGKRAEVVDALYEAGLDEEAAKVKSSKQTPQAAVNEAHLALKKVKPGSGVPVSKELAKEVAAIAASSKVKKAVSPGGGLVAPLQHPAAEVKLSKKLCPLCGFNLPVDRVAKLSVNKRTPQTDKERREDYKDTAVKNIQHAMFRVSELWLEISSKQPSRTETVQKYRKIEDSLAELLVELEKLPC